MGLVKRYPDLPVRIPDCAILEWSQHFGRFVQRERRMVYCADAKATEGRIVYGRQWRTVYRYGGNQWKLGRKRDTVPLPPL